MVNIVILQFLLHNKYILLVQQVIIVLLVLNLNVTQDISAFQAHQHQHQQMDPLANSVIKETIVFKQL